MKQRYSTLKSSVPGVNRSRSYEYESLEDLNSAGIKMSASDWDRHRPASHGPMPTSYSGSALNRLLTEEEEYLTRKYFNGRLVP